jgi:enamine deaminase RidA (YjgF/YER057c/UK114 family)
MIDQRLADLGITLPDAPTPVANYVTAVQTGSLVYLSGHVSTKPGREVRGKLGAEVSVEAGYAAARSVAIDLIATLKSFLGSLDRVKRVVKLTGMVNATPDFADHPKVMNGASDLLVEVFGDAGRHARAATGMGSLPGNAAVEIELIVEVA